MGELTAFPYTQAVGTTHYIFAEYFWKESHSKTSKRKESVEDFEGSFTNPTQFFFFYVLIR